MKNIILVGPRGVGKTSIGVNLSKMFKIPLIDADVEFMKIYGTIDAFVGSHSWEKFREKEAALLQSICLENINRTIVLSPGGGAVAHSQGEKYRKQNVDILKNFGNIFYLLPYDNLCASAEVLDKRVAADLASRNTRPNLSTLSTLEVLKERDPLYRAAANNVVLTKDFSPYQIARYIKRIIEN